MFNREPIKAQFTHSKSEHRETGHILHLSNKKTGTNNKSASQLKEKTKEIYHIYSMKCAEKANVMGQT